MLYLLNQREATVGRLQQAVELDPTYAEAWDNLGNIQAELGFHSRAVEAFRRALNVDLDYADAHYNLAQTLKEVGAYRFGRSQDWLKAKFLQTQEFVVAEFTRARGT